MRCSEPGHRVLVAIERPRPSSAVALLGRMDGAARENVERSKAWVVRRPRTLNEMTTHHFATVSIRVLGVAAIAVGVVFAGSSGIMRALGVTSLTSSSTPDLLLHDTYYVISHVDDAWLAPGAIAAIIGVLLLVSSRRLGALLARGTASES